MTMTNDFPERVALHDGRVIVHAGQCPLCEPGIHIYRWESSREIAWECTADEMRDALADGWGQSAPAASDDGQEG